MDIVKSKNQRPNYDPWREFFDNESFFSPTWLGKTQNSFPAVNVSEDEKSYSVDVVAPGFKKDDFKVHVEDDLLTISAETKNESTENGNSRQFSRREYSYSSFTRSFSLPENAKDDSITASYTDGILKLSIPKSKQQVRATKEIKIS